MTEARAKRTIRVEVAYAETGRQFLRPVELAAGACVADAIAESRLAHEFSIDTAALDVGLWSRRVARDAIVRDGDRVELYRPLKIDPKESRRRRAQRSLARHNARDQP